MILNYLDAIPIDLTHVEDYFDVIDLTKMSNPNVLISHFVFNKNNVQIPRNQFVIKIDDSSDTSFLCVLVRKIRKTQLYQIDIYHKNLMPYIQNMPIATMLFQNKFPKNNRFKTFFDYKLTFKADIIDEETFEQSIEVNNIFSKIAELVISTCSAISSVKAHEYFGYFPKQAALLDGTVEITTTKSKFLYAIIKDSK